MENGCNFVIKWSEECWQCVMIVLTLLLNPHYTTQQTWHTVQQFQSCSNMIADYVSITEFSLYLFDPLLYNPIVVRCNPTKRTNLLYVILCPMHWYANLAQYISWQRIRKVPTFWSLTHLSNYIYALWTNASLFQHRNSP